MKLIPKYQNEGLVTRQDNTYVAKPTIPLKLKLKKRTYTPTQSYVSQNNRSEWQREQGRKKADEEYKKYVEDKKMQQGLENLNGLLNLVDLATGVSGVGSVVGKGLRWGGKKVANLSVKRMINDRASDYLSRARIGDILRESGYITPDRLIKEGSMTYLQQYLDNTVQDMHVVNDENPANSLYKVANYAKDTDAQATASSGNIYMGKDGMFKIFNEYGGNPKKYQESYKP